MKYLAMLKIDGKDTIHRRKVTARDVESARKQILAREAQAGNYPGDIEIIDIRRDLSLGGYVWAKELNIPIHS